MPNYNGKGQYGVKCGYGTFEAYDSLPKEVRDVLKIMPFDITAESTGMFMKEHGLEALERKILEITQGAALLAYGPDHPQAQGNYLKPLRL